MNQQSRAELAAAGRRKLEEFRKAKAAGNSTAPSSVSTPKATEPLAQPQQPPPPLLPSPLPQPLPPAPTQQAPALPVPPPAPVEAPRASLPVPPSPKAPSPLASPTRRSVAAPGASPKSAQQQLQPTLPHVAVSTTTEVKAPAREAKVTPPSSPPPSFATPANESWRTTIDASGPPSSKAWGAGALWNRSSIPPTAAPIEATSIVAPLQRVQQAVPSFLQPQSTPAATAAPEPAAFGVRSGTLASSYAALADRYDAASQPSTTASPVAAPAAADENRATQRDGSSKSVSDFLRPQSVALNTATLTEHTIADDSGQPASGHGRGSDDAAPAALSRQLSQGSLAASDAPLSERESGRGSVTDLSSRYYQQQQQRAQSKDAFKELQLHIDELTQERFTLQRAVESASKLSDHLAEENESLVQALNARVQQAAAAREENEFLRKEVAARTAAALNATAARDAYEAAVRESQDRQKSLAAEVVALEERLLQVRNEQLRNRSDTTGAAEVVSSMRVQLEETSRERTELLTQLQRLRDENAELQEALATLRHQHRQAVQQLHAAQQNASGSSREYANEDSQHQEEGKRRAGDDATAVPPSTLLAAATLAGRSPDDHDPENDSTIQEDEEEASLASILSPELRALLPDTVCSLAPQDTSRQLQSGGGAVMSSALVVRSVENIYELLDALAAEKQSWMAEHRAQRAEIGGLQGTNQELMARIEAMQQRMELAVMQQAAQSHAAGRG